MRVYRALRTWDRFKGEFVNITVEDPPDVKMPCKDCRSYDETNSSCEGVGSWYRKKRIPFPEFVRNASECMVRLHPYLMTYMSA